MLRIKDTQPIFVRDLSDENWRSVLVQRLRIFVLARSQDYSQYLLRGFGLVSLSWKVNSFWSQPVVSLQTSRTKIGGSVFDPWHLFFLLHGRFLASLWAATTSKRRVGHPNEIHFVNPKCLRILCVHNFRVWSISPKTSHFANFRVPMEKNVRVGSILMPLTFHKHPQTINFCLEHVTHILKAIDLAVHLKYFVAFNVHPVTCQIFLLHRGSDRKWHH